MPLTMGTRLGVYEIEALLGAGGMGEVYRARDTKLGREVAIKVLPEAFARDPHRLARFEREARLLASLNHPNIAAIYGLEESGPVRFLILELVPGQTLAERLQDGPLPLEEALAVCGQIAEALEAAHTKAIFHRDLKPANVKVTPEGRVKVLDFGLAKEGGPLEGDLSQSPTLTVGGTKAGMILGTAAYMSPEQARGMALDKRTDVWSFGCVLYETLSGRQAYADRTVSDTVAAILKNEPDWKNLPETTPLNIQVLLHRCLRKDLHRRLRDIGDARIEIEEALASPRPPSAPAGAPQPVPGRRTRLWHLTALAAILAGLAGWWVAGRFRGQEPYQLVRLHRLTDFAGLEESPALSPDGKSVAFTASVGGRRQIWVRLLAGGAPLQITRDAADHQSPRWSPDSTSLLYFTPPAEGESQGTIWEISALGGAPRRIASSLGGADLSRDGKHIAFFRFNSGQVELQAAARDGSSPRALARLSADFLYSHPRWSPDGSWIGYQRANVFEGDIFAVPANGGEPRQITREANLLGGFAWRRDSSGILYSSPRGSTILYLPPLNLWTVSLSGDGLRQLTFGEESYVHPDLSATEDVAASRVRLQFDIWKFPVDGAAEENVRRAVRITRQTGHVQTPSAAPGDKEVVYLSDTGGHGNLWVVRPESGETRRLTYEEDPAVALGVPVWSPDGQQIVFVSTRNLRGWDFGLWLVNPDGSNLHNVAQRGGWACWSGDGHWLYYAVSRQGVYHVEKISAEGGQPVTVRTDNAQGPAIAPDGSALYYTVPLAMVNGVSDFEIRVARPENGPSQLLVRIPGSRIPGWQTGTPGVHPIISPGGKWLALLLGEVEGPSSNIWAMPVSGGAMRQVTDFGTRPTFIARRVSWSHDGRSIFAAVGEGDADVVLLEGLRP